MERHVYPRNVVSVSWHYKNPTRRVGLEQYGPHHQFISLKINLFSARNRGGGGRVVIGKAVHTVGNHILITEKISTCQRGTKSANFSVPYEPTA